MGNKQIKAQTQAMMPSQCDINRVVADQAKKKLDDAQTEYNQRKALKDQCSPSEAKATQAAARGPTECQSNDVALNMTRNDLATKKAKWAICNPEIVITDRIAQLKKEADDYSARIRKEQSDANTSFNIKITAIQKLTNSARQLYKTLFEKEKELAGLAGTRQNTEQLERRERRMFLDSDPQGGVGGAPAVRTADDRVLLAFWITYGAALLAGIILVLQVFGPQLNATDTKSKVGIGALTLLAGYSVAYYFISNFG